MARYRERRISFACSGERMCNWNLLLVYFYFAFAFETWVQSHVVIGECSCRLCEWNTTANSASSANAKSKAANDNRVIIADYDISRELRKLQSLRPEKRKKIRLTACAELVAWYRSQLVWRRSIRKSRAVTISHRHDVDIAGSPSFDDRCCAFGLWPTFNEFVDFESRRIINIFLFIS